MGKTDSSEEIDKQQTMSSEEEYGLGEIFREQMEVVCDARRLENFFDSLPNKWLDTDAQKEAAVMKNATVAAKNPHRNRFPNVVPFDDNRVIIENARNSYVNASKIFTGFEKSYIAAQTPYVAKDKRQASALEPAYGAFWDMVYQQNINAIIMLTPDFGDNEDTRLYDFLPVNTLKKKSFIVKKKDKEVKTVRVTLRRFKTVGEGKSLYELRELMVDYCEELPSNKNPQASRYSDMVGFSNPKLIYHIRLIGSGTSETLDCVSYLQFYSSATRFIESRKTVTEESSQTPFTNYLVSCSDGSSDSGLFILLDIVLTQIRKERKAKRVDVFDLFKKLRQRRKGFLRRPEMLKFCMSCIDLAVPLLDKADYMMHLLCKLIDLEQKRLLD